MTWKGSKMNKRVICILICIFLLAGLCGCSKDEPQQGGDNSTADATGESAEGTNGGGQTGTASASGNDAFGGSQEVTSGLRASAEAAGFKMFSDNRIFGHSREDYEKAIQEYKALKLDLGSGFEGFCSQVNEMYDKGIDYMGLGIPYCTQFGLGFAQGSAAALRYAVELRLQKLGIAYEENELPRDWDEIFGISYSSPMAFYMQALSIEETSPEQADMLREQGAMNVPYENMIPDADCIRKAGEAELKTLYEKLTAYEKEIYIINPIIPKPCSERDGLIFSSEYHIVATSWCLENKDMVAAVNSVENVIITNPFEISLYPYAAQVALSAGDVNAAVDFVNNGLLLDDENGDINLYAAILAYGASDLEAAAGYLEKAEKAGVSGQYTDLLKGTANAVKGGA